MLEDTVPWDAVVCESIVTSRRRTFVIVKLRKSWLWFRCISLSFSRKQGFKF